jgi:hypothetical protein
MPKDSERENLPVLLEFANFLACVEVNKRRDFPTEEEG